MRHILLTALALIFTACSDGGSSSPVQPTSTSPAPTTTNSTTTPATASSPTTKWLVTHRFVSVTGADNCWVQRQRERLTGVVFTNLDMTVTRSNGAISIDSPWFKSYTGTTSAEEFTAKQSDPLDGTSVDCGGITIVQRTGVSNLAGRFAPDDQTLSATESNVYPLNTGETVTYAWDWQAKRQN